MPLSVHSFSTNIVRIYYNDSWAAQIKNSSVYGSRGLGRNDKRLGLVLGKSWNLTGKTAGRDFRDWPRKEGLFSGHQAAEATGAFLITLSLL